MDLTSRVMVNVALLALVAQVTVCQHWSYGWLPGGKRSVGELEATIRMMGSGGLVSLPDQTSFHVPQRRRPYKAIDDETNIFKSKKHLPQE